MVILKYRVELINDLRSKMATRFPSSYKNFVKVTSILIVFFRYRKFFLNGKNAHWYIQVKNGEDFLQSCWYPFYSLSTPLYLPLARVTQIKFPALANTHSNLHQFNPSVASVHDGLKICWRISDNYDHPATNLNGEPKVKPFGGECNGIGYGKIMDENLYGNFEITNSQVLIEPAAKQRSEKHMIQDAYARQLDFEDPRFIDGDSNTLILHGKYTSRGPHDTDPLYEVVLFDIQNDDFSVLNIKSRMRVEKNWVSLNSDAESYKILRSTDPFLLISVDKIDCEVTELTTHDGPIGDLHNGSNFLLVDEKFYIRVVRRTISLNGLRGVRVNFLIIHDLNLVEISRSMPFLFEEFSCEICNSIALYKDNVYFAWGKNDEAGYIGYIEKHSLLDWIEKNKT